MDVAAPPAAMPGAGPAEGAAATPFAAAGPALRPPPGVAPSGRRLTRRFGWVGFVILGVFGLFWLIQLISGGIGFLWFLG
jgi:hypothetical protein